MAKLGDIVNIGEDVTLYCGDCLGILPGLEQIDAVVTDPPYGVNLGKYGAAHESRPQYLAKRGYASFNDTPENYELLIVPRLKVAIDAADRALVFAAGTQMWSLPRPDAIGGVFLPAGCGRNKWGFQCHSHFCLYGACPDLHKGAQPTGWSSTERAKKSAHPCPKPDGWMTKCVKLASRDGEVVLDPFMGSGTTGVACVRTGRKFIGVEIEPRYFEIACKRIKAEVDQLKLAFEDAM